MLLQRVCSTQWFADRGKGDPWAQAIFLEQPEQPKYGSTKDLSLVVQVQLVRGATPAEFRTPEQISVRQVLYHVEHLC